MKLIDADDKLRVLHESVRFGNKQIRSVMQQANDIIVGIEYEFKYDDEYEGGTLLPLDDDYDYSEATIEEAKAEIIKNRKRTAGQRIITLNNILRRILRQLTEIIDELVLIVNVRRLDGLSNVAAVIHDNGVGIKKERMMFNDIISTDIIDALENVMGINIEGNSSNYSLDKYIDAVSDFSSVNDVVDVIYSIVRTIDNFTGSDVDDFIKSLAIYNEKLINLRTDISGNLIDSHGRPPVIEDLYNNIMNEIESLPITDEEITGHLGNTRHMSRFDVIKKHLLQHGFDLSQIERLTDEPNSNIDVEVITNPLRLDQALAFMDKMFDYIDEFGETNNDTGMHVNMSIKGHNLMDIDPLKLIVLLDHAFIMDRFPVRGYVADMQDALKRPAFYTTLAREFRSSDVSTQDILRNAERRIETDEKYQTINFGTIGLPDDGQRIEFRFFGDKDYHKNYSEMEWHIQRTAYMMLAALDPDFERVTYLKSFWRMLQTNFAIARRNLTALSIAESILRMADEEQLANKVADINLVGFINLYQFMAKHEIDDMVVVNRLRNNPQEAVAFVKKHKRELSKIV